MPCRVRAALVCKAWREVERTYPHQPQDIQLRPQNLQPSFIQWHLRDTRRLREVNMLFKYFEFAAALSQHVHWECLEHSLKLPAIKAPALRSLGILLSAQLKKIYGTKTYADASFRVMPLILALTQLQSLALSQWEVQERIFLYSAT